MNPRRWRIALRWCLGLALLLHAGLWGLTTFCVEPEVVAGARFTVGERPAADFDPAKAADRLDKALEELAAAQSNAQTAAQAIAPDPQLLNASVERASPSVSLSMIFLSAKGPMAVIDNEIYGRNSRLPDGRVVERIDRDGVLLVDKTRRERLVWAPLAKVELKRGGDARSFPTQSVVETTSGADSLARVPELLRELLETNQSRGRRYGEE